jgi:hypothetical protein
MFSTFENQRTFSFDFLIFFEIKEIINLCLLNFWISNKTIKSSYWIFWNQKTYRFQIFKPFQFLIGFVISLLGTCNYMQWFFNLKNLTLYYMHIVNLIHMLMSSKYV